mgnify:CR=1 FL=1
MKEIDKIDDQKIFKVEISKLKERREESNELGFVKNLIKFA